MSTGTAPLPQPSKRNPWLIQALPLLCFAAMFPLGNYLGTTAFRSAPSFAQLAGMALTVVPMIMMLREVASITGKLLPWWHFIIPIYGLYWVMVKVRAEVGDAKQKSGKAPARSGLLYLFVPLYSMASDLNDLAE